MKIGEHLKIVLSTLAWCAIAGYFVFAVRMCRSQEAAVVLTQTTVNINDIDEIPIVDEQSVLGWIKEYGTLPDSIPLNGTDTEKLKSFIEGKTFVKRAKVYTDIDGRLTVEIWQRRPVARFALRNGHDFYVSEDFHIMPAGRGGALSVPLVTGSFDVPFAAGYEGKIPSGEDETGNFTGENILYFNNLINFVRLIGSSSFWDTQIVQINVEGGGSNRGAGSWKEPQIELIPRVGRHIILFGNLEDIQEKLDKLMLFYNKALDYEGWEAYRTIDLKYKDQIVCTRR